MIDAYTVPSLSTHDDACQSAGQPLVGMTSCKPLYCCQKREEALTAQMALGGRAMTCQGAGCTAGTWTGGAWSGRSGLYCCVGLVMLESPRALSTFSMRTSASADTLPLNSLLVAVSTASRSTRACSSFACGAAADAAPSSAMASARRSMMPCTDICTLSADNCVSCRSRQRATQQHFHQHEEQHMCCSARVHVALLSDGTKCACPRIAPAQLSRMQPSVCVDMPKALLRRCSHQLASNAK